VSADTTGPLTWFGGHIGVMDGWTLHLLERELVGDLYQTLCGEQTALAEPGVRLPTAREANSPKCRWCETCLADAQRPLSGDTQEQTT